MSYDSHDREMTAVGNVVIKKQDGSILKTDKAVIKSGEKGPVIVMDNGKAKLLIDTGNK